MSKYFSPGTEFGKDFTKKKKTQAPPSRSSQPGGKTDEKSIQYTTRRDRHTVQGAMQTPFAPLQSPRTSFSGLFPAGRVDSSWGPLALPVIKLCPGGSVFLHLILSVHLGQADASRHVSLALSSLLDF